ncbi:hypothetical protein BPAE_0122g00030 [Botrytis paeoniae]|uniref:Uncharacterized protein n=1 Tax=Botrytis paeoniae TaxID=278948 RepID=A0A4Z1FK23_9HELO|nr:hypothetical protein BPAE_0122g00030 [Botrytis paeoniae]
MFDVLNGDDILKHTEPHAFYTQHQKFWYSRATVIDILSASQSTSIPFAVTVIAPRRNPIFLADFHELHPAQLAQ